jgi:hypothetical protein
MDNKTKPFQHFCNNPVSGYPLTDGELTILADRWWDVAFDLRIWLTLSGCYGGAESDHKNYALDRIDLLAGILGEQEIQRIHDEVEARWKDKLDEKYWRAFKEDHAIFQDEAAQEAADRESRTAAVEDEKQHDGRPGDLEIDRYTYRFNGRDGTYNLIEIVNPQDKVIATLYYWDEPDTDEAKRVEDSAATICKHLNH